MNSKPNQHELTFNKCYILKKKISSGSFGVVFLSYDIERKINVAIKLEKATKGDEEIRSVLREGAILNHLKGMRGIPQVFWTGSEHNYDVIAMSLLGKDLASLVKAQKKFSIKTIVMLADQLISMLELIHGKGIIHRDIKPENILMGKGKEANFVYIIDFGISKIYRDSQGRHIIYRENKPFIGTTRYASISSHLGRELSRKDDLESLGYVLVFLLRGSLPWQNLGVSESEKTKTVGKLKMKITNEELCKDLPNEFIKYFEYVKKLTFKQTPDYRFLRSLFAKISKDRNFTIDWLWDWVDPDSYAKNSRQGDGKKKVQSMTEMKEISYLRENGSSISMQIGLKVKLSAETESIEFLKPPDIINSSRRFSRNSDSYSREHSNSSFLSGSPMNSSVHMNYLPSEINFDDESPQQQYEDGKSKKARKKKF